VALGNTPRRETNIALEASKSYALGVRFRHEDGSVVDLTNAVVRMVIAEQAHRGGVEVLDLDATPVNEAFGLLQFRLQAQDLALEPGTYPFDVTLIPESGYSTPIIKGNFEINSNTDLDASNVYTEVTPESDVTVIMAASDVLDVTIERIDGLYTAAAQLIQDFRDETTIEIAKAAASAQAAEAAASLSEFHAEELRSWLESVGYPFWQGTQTEYNQLAPAANVLYLIVDG